MIKVKELLCDIITNAYGKNCDTAYTKFFVEVSRENQKSRHGYYKQKEKKIVLLNTYREDEAILCSAIHELAHHVDCCNRGTSSHDKVFYEIYEKLLFTALDMGVIHKSVAAKLEQDTSGAGKVKKIMERYVPHPIPYKNDLWVISIYDAYEYKEYLKSEGYQYNKNTKAWEKEVPDYAAECKRLKFLPGATLDFSKATSFHFEGEIKLVAKGDTYSLREELKEAGCKFEDKTWVYYAKNEEEANVIKSAFPKAGFVQK